eukprot:160649-Chlamydomonas_euryale.AAC.6
MASPTPGTGQRWCRSCGEGAGSREGRYRVGLRLGGKPGWWAEWRPATRIQRSEDGSGALWRKPRGAIGPVAAATTAAAAAAAAAASVAASSGCVVPPPPPLLLHAPHPNPNPKP